MAPIENLPTELLLEILVWVKAHSNASLRKCSLVNCSWRDNALPLLYINVVLTKYTIATFCKQFNKAYGSNVQSLSIRIGFPGNGSVAPNEDIQLKLVVENLVHLSQLRTFSFIAKGVTSIPFSEETLISMCENLPETCVNLEIDLENSALLQRHRKDTHVCESIRDILPRMRNIRLHFKSMCSKLITKGKTEQLISLPNLNTLLIQCISNNSIICRSCNDLMGPFHGWHHITQGLVQIVHQGLCPPSAKVYMVTSLNRDISQSNSFFSYACAEMVSKTTQVFPICYPSFTLRNFWLLRTADGQEVLSDLSNLKMFVEGEVWKTSAGGTRLAAETWEQKQRNYLAPAFTAKPLPVIPSWEWIEKNPQMDCLLWVNERLVGTKLLFGERRDGPENYLSENAVYEHTPQGYFRWNTQMHSLLFRGDDPRI